MKDLTSKISAAISVKPVADKVTQTGGGVDLAGFLGAVVLFISGTLVDGTFTPTVEESADDGVADAYAPVAAGDLLGTLTVFDAAHDEGVRAIGYIGQKRYIRAKLTVSGSPATGGPTGAIIIRGEPRDYPTS